MHSPWYGIIIGSYHLDTSRLSSNSIRSYTVGLLRIGFVEIAPCTVLKSSKKTQTIISSVTHRCS